MVFRTASFCKSRSRQRSLSPPFPSFSLTGRRKRKGRLSWRQRISKGALNLRHRSCQHGLAGDFEGPVRKPAPLSIIFRSAALCVTGRLSWRPLSFVPNCHNVLSLYLLILIAYRGNRGLCIQDGAGPQCRKKIIDLLSSLPGSPLLSNILTFILSLRSICGGLFHFAREQSTTVRPMKLRVFNPGKIEI